jgi:hypothetical protein
MQMMTTRILILMSDTDLFSSFTHNVHLLGTQTMKTQARRSSFEARYCLLSFSLRSRSSTPECAAGAQDIQHHYQSPWAGRIQAPALCHLRRLYSCGSLCSQYSSHPQMRWHLNMQSLHARHQAQELRGQDDIGRYGRLLFELTHRT